MWVKHENASWPGVQLTRPVVVLAASLPHTKVRRSIRSLHVEHEILYKTHFVCCEDYLQRATQQRRQSSKKPFPQQAGHSQQVSTLISHFSQRPSTILTKWPDQCIRIQEQPDHCFSTKFNSYTVTRYTAGKTRTAASLSQITGTHDIQVNHRYIRHTSESQVHMAYRWITGTYAILVNYRYIQHTGESQVRMKYRWITGAHNIHANHKYTQHTG